MPTETGIYTGEDMVVGHIHSSALLEYMQNTFNKQYSVIDFGCGTGYYIDNLNDRGFDVIGVEGSVYESHRHYVKHLDLTSPIELGVTGTVISLEVGEHIPREYENIFLNSVTNHTNKHLILSWAVEGQAGIGHINCRNNDYIIFQVEARGLVYNHGLTVNIRSLIEDECDYFRNTLMVFEKV
jgi:hypothetical protein